MKRCPTCKKEFEDSLTYCLDDGSPLVAESRPDSEATIVSPSPSQSGPSRELPPTRYAHAPGAPPQYNALPGYNATPPERRVWPWVLAGALVLGFLALVVAAVITIPKLVRSSKNTNGPVVVASPSPQTFESPSPWESPADASAPTDEDVVLSQLSELERKWTVANIEGDKDALDPILAEEYSGGNPPHTKKEYIESLEPDPSVKKWDLQDLSVDLDGDRATITGYLRQETTRGAEVYSFTDEFVWRNGRWQATGSRATRVK
jgi:hypothetical protein